MLELGRLAQSGQPSLVKIDGLREHGKIYTVMLDGPAEEGPSFRKNTGDLHASLEGAIGVSSPEWNPSAVGEVFLK